MFKFVRDEGGSFVPEIKQMPSTASVTYKNGDALVLSGGGLAKAGATAKPQYICAEDYVAPATGQKNISVYPVLEGFEFDTTFAADGSSIKVGDKVTIHTDSAQVTATTTSGVFTVLEKLGSGELGTAVRGKF